MKTPKLSYVWKAVVVAFVLDSFVISATANFSSSKFLPVMGTISYNQSIDVFAHYGLWYRTPFGAGYWSYWAGHGHNPNNIIYGDWKRDITSDTDYPLCGPFDCGNEEIDLWNIRLAKAAGITAFWVEALPYEGLTGYMYKVGFTNMMDAANKENFKIAMFVWAPQYNSGDLDSLTNQAIAVLHQWKDNPAYLRIDNKPVYVINRLENSGWFTPQDLNTFKTNVEQAIGEPIYLIWEASGAWAMYANTGYIPNSWWSCTAVDSFFLYNSWNDNGAYQFGNFSISDWQNEYYWTHSMAHQYGKKFIYPIVPGFDNIGIGGSDNVSREGGMLYQRQINAMKGLNFTLDGVMVSNWNDFGEQSEIMPSLTDFNGWTAPYQYLKMTTQLTGAQFHIPTYPPTNTVDQVFQSKFTQEMNTYPPS